MKRYLLFPLLVSSLFALETFRLPNGMKVMLIDRKIPSVFLTVFYRAGSSFDPEGEGGLSYLASMMSFAGTRKSSPWEQVFFLEKVGGGIEVKVEKDFVIFKSHFPKKELPLALWYEHERMKPLRISEDFFVKQKKRLGMEVRRSLLDEDLRVEGLVDTFLYSDSPYGRMPFGSPEELERIPLEHVRKFHRKFFQPRAALMVVVGNIIPREREIILKMFSPIKSRQVIFPEKIDFQTRGVDRKILVKGLSQKVYALCYRVSSPTCSKRTFLELVRLYLQKSLQERRVKSRISGSFEVKVRHFLYSSSLCITIKSRDLSAWEASLRGIFSHLKASPPSKSFLSGLKLSLIRSLREEEIDPSRWGEVLGRYNLVFNCGQEEVLATVSSFSPPVFWENVRKVFYPFNRVRLVLLPWKQ